MKESILNLRSFNRKHLYIEVSAGGCVSAKMGQLKGPDLRRQERRLLASRDGIREPIETFIQTSAVNTAAALHVPVALRDGVNLELFSDFCDRIGVGEILLVGKDQDSGVGHVWLGKKALELQASFLSTIAVI